MKYMGSKARIAKEIYPIITEGRGSNQFYVEPFLGGANMMACASGNRLAGEINPFIADMWAKLLDGWFPEYIEKDVYEDIRNNKHNYPRELVGWVGIACSYSGKWFGGYAGKVLTRQGTRDYQEEAIRNVKKQLPKLSGLRVKSCGYDKLEIPDNSIIYCDPPYKNTTQYKDDFDHDTFWEWCRHKTLEGHKVYVSEYNAPDDFTTIWKKNLKSSLSANGKSGGNKDSIECLFMYKNI